MGCDEAYSYSFTPKMLSKLTKLSEEYNVCHCDDRPVLWTEAILDRDFAHKPSPMSVPNPRELHALTMATPHS